MPIRLSEIISQQKWIEVDVAGEMVKIAYTPNKITLRRATELGKLIKELDDNPDVDIGAETARMFCDLVNSWDILGEDERPYPIDIKSLQEFPANIMNIILKAVNDDVEEHEDSKKSPSETSGDGFQQTGSMESAQTGTR